ncbi:MAG: hypothetical protein COB04_08595 [Gammaproteobacteria bacterium]|nr:MAG: hypothetical protein COB04_08595 [Gammaproteobacteria bacterium]
MNKNDLTLTAQQITDYLTQNPDFFQQHPETLTQLDIPHRNGGAISLVERQVALLRELNIELRHRHASVIEVAQENEDLFEKTKTLSLALVKAQSLIETVTLLDQTLSKDFNADCFSLTFFNADLTLSHPLVSLADKSIALESIPSFIDTKKPICGPLRASESAFFFQAQAELIGSAAIIPLRHETLDGFLCIGSFNENHFHPQIGTLFISYMGELLSQVLHQQAKIESTPIALD